MDSAKQSYSQAKNKLSEGTGNLVKLAQDIKELGVKTKTDLPNNLLERPEKKGIIMKLHIYTLFFLANE